METKLPRRSLIRLAGVSGKPAAGEYLSALRRQDAETRRLFSNAHKPEREKMVCRAFLHSMGVGFSEDEISVGASELPDIAFRGAAFQITEVLDEGRKRSLEHMELEIKYQNARSARDVMWSLPHHRRRHRSQQSRRAAREAR